MVGEGMTHREHSIEQIGRGRNLNILKINLHSGPLREILRVAFHELRLEIDSQGSGWDNKQDNQHGQQLG